MVAFADILRELAVQRQAFHRFSRESEPNFEHRCVRVNAGNGVRWAERKLDLDWGEEPAGERFRGLRGDGAQGD